MIFLEHELGPPSGSEIPKILQSDFKNSEALRPQAARLSAAMSRARAKSLELLSETLTSP